MMKSVTKEKVFHVLKLVLLAVTVADDAAGVTGACRDRHAGTAVPAWDGSSCVWTGR